MMEVDFDFGGVKSCEFGVGRDEQGGQSFQLVPVDDNVQDALIEMVKATMEALLGLPDDPARYEPSEKHGTHEYLYLELDDELAVRMRELHEAKNLPMDATALQDPSRVFAYYTRMMDGQNRRLTALRRATQFKGVLKSRLVRFVTDALKIVEDRIFKLDSDFDLLIDSTAVHILRPSGFEFAGRLQEAILAAVPTNIAIIRADLEFVDFGGIQTYASKHPRAARYLASIRSLGVSNVNKESLLQQCNVTGVEVSESGGTITVPQKQIMGFLEVLDRRRYEVQLVSDTPERFKASSRRKL